MFLNSNIAVVFVQLKKKCICRRTFIYKNIFHCFQRVSKGPTCFRAAQYELNEIGFGGWRGRIAGVTFSYMYLQACVTQSPNCVIDSILSTRDYCAFINSSSKPVIFDKWNLWGPIVTLHVNSQYYLGKLIKRKSYKFFFKYISSY